MEEQKMKAPSGGQKSHGFATGLIFGTSNRLGSNVEHFDIYLLKVL